MPSRSTPRLRSTAIQTNKARTALRIINLFLDQVLAYLLMSAASAAASRNHLWTARFGEDQFSRKVSVAVWFALLSANALISMANLFARM